MTFGSRLRELRESQDVTLTQAADRIGVKAATISNWERVLGLTPTPERVHQLCEVLGITDHEKELLRLANLERGEVTIRLSDLSEPGQEFLIRLEQLCRESKLTAKQAKACLTAIND